MHFRVLGGLDVYDDEGRRLPIDAAKERELLGALLAQAGSVVSAERLIDVLWGIQPPRTAHKTLQTYISHLRRHLPGRISTRPPGYILSIDAKELDSAEFERLVSEGRLALLRLRYADAEALLAAALELWNGDPFQGLDGNESLVAESVRLTELHAGAIEDWVEARLSIGKHPGIVGELEALVRRFPLRERLWELMMVAQYRSGRQAEALRTFQRARQLLVDELGVEPGPGLQATEAAVLAHDPKLIPAAETAPSASYVATTNGLRIAYWTHGQGEREVVFLAEVTFNLELLWESGLLSPLPQTLSRHGRLIAIQRRDTGLSDRNLSGKPAPPEECVEDIDTVLDEVGAGQVSLLGWGHGGQLALVYAALRPERVGRVAVVNSYARLAASPDYPQGWPEQSLEFFYRYVGEHWGQAQRRGGGAIFAAEVESDPDFANRISRIERLTSSPRQIVETIRTVHNFDIRWALPKISCPVLVIYLNESPTGVDNARFLADHLSVARYLELDGHFIPTAAESEQVAQRLEEFLLQSP